MGSGRPAKRNEPVRSALRLAQSRLQRANVDRSGSRGCSGRHEASTGGEFKLTRSAPTLHVCATTKALWKQRDRARTRRSGVRFPRARQSASGPSLKLPRTRCTGRPMRLACCDSCCAASLACARSRRAAVRWLVCVDAKSAVHAHAPATIGLDALLPAAGATHGPADELQQRARCPPVTYTRSTSCLRRQSFSRSRRSQRPVVQSFSRSVVRVGPRKKCLARKKALVS